MIERDTGVDPSATNVTMLFESAQAFGLTPDETWKTAVAALDRLPDETRASCINELSGALATRVLEKQRG
jgi:hypothetical protein